MLKIWGSTKKSWRKKSETKSSDITCSKTHKGHKPTASSQLAIVPPADTQPLTHNPQPTKTTSENQASRSYPITASRSCPITASTHASGWSEPPVATSWRKQPATHKKRRARSKHSSPPVCPIFPRFIEKGELQPDESSGSFARALHVLSSYIYI